MFDDDNVSIEELEAAASIYDHLVVGDFYTLQEEALEWIRNHNQQEGMQMTRDAIDITGKRVIGC